MEPGRAGYRAVACADSGIIMNNAPFQNTEDYDMPVRWVLSERCGDCPRCRPRGTDDLYGLGPGVYPDDKFPDFPEHWGCNCAKEYVPPECG